MSHTTRRRALAAAATALLALAPSALAADRAPQLGPPSHPSAVAAQPGPRTGTHALTPSDIDRAANAKLGTYTPGAIPAVSYPSDGAYTPGSIPAVSYPRRVAPARAAQAPDSSSGVSPTTIGLGIAGSLLVIGAIAGMTLRIRRTGRTRIAA
jgi:hypothetical protein